MEALTYLTSAAVSNKNGGKEFITGTALSSLNWLDFLILALALLLPVSISTAQGFFGSRHDGQSSEAFLMGDRHMSSVLVGLSLFCGFVSTVSVLGNPVEVYLHGTQLSLTLLALIPVSLALVHLYLPVYFNMELSSPFQYFERRFTRTARMLISTLSLAQMLVYMTLVIYFTSSVLMQVTGIQAQILSAVILGVSVFCNYVGGYKGIIWTNAVQVLILISSLLTVVVFGFLSIQDFQLQLDHILDGNRLEFFNLDPDPRTSRATVWTSTIGSYFMWISFYASSQVPIQRLISLPSRNAAKRAVFFNVFLLILVLSLTYIIGLLIFAKYFGCDPVKTERIDNYSLLFPLYVSSIFKNYFGLYGFCIAGILCAGLSTVASSLNSMSSLVTLDYFKHWIPNISEASLVFLAKISNVFLGGLSFACVLAAHNFEHFLPLIWRLIGMSVGPILGIFTLGMFFPWTNSKGSLVGMFSVLALLSSEIIISNNNEIQSGPSYDQQLPNQSLQLIITENCIAETNYKNATHNLSNTTLQYNDDEIQLMAMNPLIPVVHSHFHSNQSQIEKYGEMLSVSYIWYPGIGCILTVLLGLLFSIPVIKFQKKLGVPPECFSPPILKLWLKWFPSHMSIWVEPDDNLMLLSSSVFSFLPRRLGTMNTKPEPNCDIEISPAY